jgi:hypothetical protein
MTDPEEQTQLQIVCAFLAGISIGAGCMLVLAGVVVLLLIQPATANYIDSAYNISINEPDDMKFIQKIRGVVNWNIKYGNSSKSWDVLEPNLTWKIRRGDCSEKSLLLAAMLQPRINATVVWGTMPSGGLHDTVEITYNNHTWIKDAGFVKLGDGLHPKEKVVEAITTTNSFKARSATIT